MKRAKKGDAIVNVNDRVELGCSMYGKSTIGVSILESVLLKVCEMEGAVTINGVLLQDTPGYKKLCSKEDAIAIRAVLQEQIANAEDRIRNMRCLERLLQKKIASKK